MPFKCSECPRDFSLKSNLTRHLRIVHNVQVKRQDIQPAHIDVYHYKCLEGCNISFRYNRELRQHLKNEHNLDMAEMIYEFPNVYEFNKWLHEEKVKNCVQYVHMTATKKKSTGVETFYYECSRTGKYTVVDDNSRKRKARKHGTVKLNRGCTSQLIVNKASDGTHSVTYYKTHYGHDTTLEHINLSKEERAAVASKLLIGMSSTGILNSVAKSDGNLRRINLLRRKDIINIRKSFKIPPQDGKSINLETINIENFITECSQQEYNPILYYKVNLENTSLIIMSKNQAEILCYSNDNVLYINSVSLNECDFELVTFYVLNDGLSGFPAACMFTNKLDYNLCELFFKKILERIEKVNCRAFVTDCSDMFYEAWKKVTGDSPELYYNASYIEIDWKLNLNKISCAETEVTKIKRKWVYETLMILQNTLEQNEFMENLEDTLKLLDNDQDFEEFLKYFLKHYSYPRRWATLYTNLSNISFSNIEQCTKSLKRYLNEDNEIRFDKIFHNLIRYIRDETLKFMMKTGSDRSIFIAENDKRHQLGTSSRYKVTNVNQTCWNITEDKVTYVIHEHTRKKCCNLSCSNCNICVHSYSCTCVDFFINNITCQHIHYIFVTYVQSIVQNENEDSEKNEEVKDEQTSEEIIIEINDLDETEIEETSIDGLQTELLEKIAVLSNNISEIRNENTLKSVLDNVNNLCHITNEELQLMEAEEDNSEKEAIIIDHSYL